MEKKKYTRQEKIKYYQDMITKATKRLSYLESEHYQEWDGDVKRQIKEQETKDWIAQMIAEAVAKSKEKAG